MAINPSKLYSDIESEEQVIQAIYINPELIYQVDLKPSDFTSGEMRQIFEAMTELWTEGALFDYKAVCDMKPELVKMRVFKLFSDAFTAANINYHARVVRDCTFNRKCREIVNKLNETLGDDDFLPVSEKHFMTLYEHHDRQQEFQGLPEILDRVEERITVAKQSNRHGIQTGFPKLDDKIVGACPGHFWIIGAYTSFGKSTLLSQMVSNICPSESMLVFSVEDSKEDKIVRLMATETGIPIKYIVRGEGDRAKLQRARKTIEGYKLSIYDDIYNLQDMEMKIKKHKMLDKSLGIVAIDFVQNIQTGGHEIYDRMSEVAITLQKIAKKHQVCVIGLSQVSEAKDKNSISLRGAQELASASDIVLWIERERDHKDYRLIIRKNRPFGETGFINMTFTETWTGMEEV